MSFESSSKSDRIAQWILLCGAVFVGLSIVVFVQFLDAILQHLYGGMLFTLYVKLRHSHGPMSPEMFVQNGRLQFSRLCLLVVFLDLGLAAWVARGTVRRLFSDFFTTPASPVNLAIFRIAVFGVTLYFFCTDYASTLWYAEFPKVLEVAPYGVGWLLPHLPINPQLAQIASILFMALCVAGVLGIWARGSALLAALTGLYVMGITQFFGKVSHDHESIWFLMLLAASPCGDALAIDALFAARKRADAGITSLPGYSLAYALPLRFASILLGFIYFFPGFQKFWLCGFYWAFSDNLKYQMYLKWMEFPGWLPLFRLDLHPWLYRSVAFATLAIEMSFLFLIFFPRLRRMAALSAASFHIGCYFFLQIFFYDLIIFYVALFDINTVLCNVGRRFFRPQLVVFYDDDCSFCRRAIAAIRTFDVLCAIRYARARQDAALYLAQFPGQDAALVKDMQSLCGEHRFAGMATYHQVARRIPLLWPFAALLELKPVFLLCEKVYQRVKHGRTCAIVKAEALPAQAKPVKAILVTGIVLLAGSFNTGMRGIYAGWPFACYPTFAYLGGSHASVLQIEAVGPDGNLLPTDSGPLHAAFFDQRSRGMLDSVLNNPGPNDERLRALWQLYVQREPALKEARAIRFYRANISIIPGDQSMDGRDLIAEMDADGSIRSVRSQ